MKFRFFAGGFRWAFHADFLSPIHRLYPVKSYLGSTPEPHNHAFVPPGTDDLNVESLQLTKKAPHALGLWNRFVLQLLQLLNNIFLYVVRAFIWLVCDLYLQNHYRKVKDNVRLHKE